MTNRRPGRPNYSAGSPFKDATPAPVETFEVGDRVTHDKFGLGSVINVEPAAVTVDFGAVRSRVVSPYTRLHKL